MDHDSLHELKALATERGGRLLSDRYLGTGVRLRWRCTQGLGHRWYARPANVKYAHSWCPDCAQSFPGTIDGMRRLAVERGGRLLSDSYTGHRTLLLWECAEKHRFTAFGSAVKGGVWCSRCRA